VSCQYDRAISAEFSATLTVTGAEGPGAPKSSKFEAERLNTEELFSHISTAKPKSAPTPYGAISSDGGGGYSLQPTPGLPNRPVWLVGGSTVHKECYISSSAVPNILAQANGIMPVGGTAYSAF
jgi:hypothetical protein